MGMSITGFFGAVSKHLKKMGYTEPPPTSTVTVNNNKLFLETKPTRSCQNMGMTRFDFDLSLQINCNGCNSRDIKENILKISNKNLAYAYSTSTFSGKIRQSQSLPVDEVWIGVQVFVYPRVVG